MKNTLLFLFLLPFSVFAAGTPLETTQELLNAAKPIDTHCATGAFANGLRDNSHLIDENDDETNVKIWVYDVFQSPDVLLDVLSCPEIEDSDDTDTIRFLPIQYTFPNGRELVINYETQPKVLEQRLQLATKRELPTDDISPEVSPTDPHATWVNTDPAWYGVMVVQSGALDEFVGPNKNNTISMDYIKNNMDKFYPRDMDGACTTRAGMGAKINNSMVHNVIHEKTAKHDNDKNNYYVAGDINLKWVSYAEIGLDVAMMVLSWGATAAAKSARIAKLTTKISKNMRALLKAENVRKYVRHAARINTATRRIENAEKFTKSFKNVTNLEKKLAKATKGSQRYERLEKQLDAARKIHSNNAIKLGRDADNIKTVQDLDKLDDFKKLRTQEIADAQQEMKNLVKTDKKVSEFVKQSDALKDVYKYSKDLHKIRQVRTGNAFQRGWQAVKNARTSLKAVGQGGKTLDRAARVARQGAKTGRLRDWLFHSTLRNAARVTKATAEISALHFALGLLADFYDYTDASTDEYTNGIEMKPFLLLGADKLDGYDNVVNYGMWLMWSGDSGYPEDDDAAYLQAMDFAQKFNQDLNETQEEENRYACDVDIYVVRPIIRNPETDHQALYWLIMNDIPWSTAR